MIELHDGTILTFSISLHCPIKITWVDELDVRYPAIAQSSSLVSLINRTSRKTPVLLPIKTTVLVGSSASSGNQRIDLRNDTNPGMLSSAGWSISGNLNESNRTSEPLTKLLHVHRVSGRPPETCSHVFHPVVVETLLFEIDEYQMPRFHY